MRYFYSEIELVKERNENLIFGKCFPQTKGFASEINEIKDLKSMKNGLRNHEKPEHWSFSKNQSKLSTNPEISNCSNFLSFQPFFI